MCLYPTTMQGDHREILEEQLANYALAAGAPYQTTPEHLIEIHLRKVHEAAMAAVEERYKKDLKPQQLQRMRQRRSHTVP